MNYLEEFLKLEEKHHMFDKKILDVDYWLFMRKWIYFDFLTKQEGTQNLSIRRQHAPDNKLAVAAQLFYHSYLHPYRIPDRTEVLISSHPRRELRNKEYICTYTTPLSESLPNTLVLERPNPYLHARPVPEKYILYVDRSILTSNLAYFVLKKFKKKKAAALYAEMKRQAEPFFQEFNRIFGQDFPMDGYLGEALRQSVLYSVKRNYYDRILQKTKPRIILEVVSYLPENMILNELGTKYGIPTVELQHGTIHERNISYVLSKGRSMPQFPDYFFAFSEFWKTMVPATIPRDQIKVVGFPYLEGEVKKAIEQAGPKEGKTVCFLSQWNVGEKLSRLAVEVSDKLGSGWTVYYKLHPAEYENWETSYPTLVGSRVKVIGKDDMNLYELFTKSDVQVGVGSTALYEGLSFGLKTYIYEALELNMFYELCSQGYAVRFSDPDFLVKELEEIPDSKGQKPVLDMEFWTVNSIGRMMEEIRKIMDSEQVIPL